MVFVRNATPDTWRIRGREKGKSVEFWGMRTDSLISSLPELEELGDPREKITRSWLGLRIEGKAPVSIHPGGIWSDLSSVRDTARQRLFSHNGRLHKGRAGKTMRETSGKIGHPNSFSNAGMVLAINPWILKASLLYGRGYSLLYRARFNKATRLVEIASFLQLRIKSRAGLFP